MAALFQIRRGSGSVSLVDGELYVNKGIDSLQYAVGDREITLLKLDESNTGSLKLYGDISASNLYVTGNIVLGGTITIGDNPDDSIVFNADLSSSIIPDATNTYDLGSTSKVYRNVYANSVSASSLTGSIFGMGNPTSFSTSVDTRLDQLESATSSLQSFTSSQESKNLTLVTYTGSVNSRLDRLQESTASLNAFSSSQETKDIVIGAYTASINSFTSSQESKNIIIGGYTSSMNTFTSSTNSRLGDIELYTSSLKTAIDVTGGNTRIIGNLIVDGTQTSLNTTETFIEDKSITLASGSTTSGIADGAGLNIAGANVSMSWEDSNQRLYFNTNIAASGSISSSTIIGLNGVSVTTYSTSVDSRIVSLSNTSTTSTTRLSRIEESTASLNTFSASVLEHIADINIKTGSFETKWSSLLTTTASLSASLHEHDLYTASVAGTNQFTASTLTRFTRIEESTASLNTFSASVNGHITDINTKTGSFETRFTRIEESTSSLNTFSASVNFHITNINTWTGSTYNTFSTSVDGRLDTLEYTVTTLDPGNVGASILSLNAATTSLQLFTASANSRLNNLEFTTSSINTSINNLNTTTASLNSSISQINSFTASNDNTSLNSYTSSLKGAITISGTDVSIAGGLTVLGTTTIIDTTTLAIKDNIIELNAGGGVNGGLVVRDATGGSTTSGSLLWDTTNDYWKAGPLGAESKLLRANGDNIVSGSSQVSYIGLSNIPIGIISSSAQIDTLFNIDGIVSGSSQITYASISSIPSGIVSGSSQVTLSSINGGGISSQVRFGSLGIDMAASVTAGRIDAAGDIVAYSTSDIRLKENIQPIQNALSKVETISGNEYNWKKEFEYIHGFKGNDVGVIAQEIQKVLPEAINERENGYLGVNYEKIIPLLIQSIKELSAKVKELENK